MLVFSFFKYNEFLRSLIFAYTVAFSVEVYIFNNIHNSEFHLFHLVYSKYFITCDKEILNVIFGSFAISL